ncbi:MAG: helix-turn-helix transcriptional regulator [Pseudomonadota bacterium]
MTNPVQEPVFSGDMSLVCGRMGHGEDVSTHFHDFGQLRYAVSGVLVTITETDSWLAPAGRITWVPPFQVHSSRSYGEADVRLLNVSAPQSEQFPAESCVFMASALMREACLALVSDQEPVDSPRFLLLVGVVATEIARAPRDLLRIPEPKDRRLKGVTSLLHANPANSATLAELGRHTGASERTLSRLFSSEFSMSFHQWRTLLRIQRALLALGQGASVTETALELGWANPSSFIDAFTEVVGETPGRYRATHAVHD